MRVFSRLERNVGAGLAVVSGCFLFVLLPTFPISDSKLLPTVRFKSLHFFAWALNWGVMENELGTPKNISAEACDPVFFFWHVDTFRLLTLRKRMSTFRVSYVDLTVQCAGSLAGFLKYPNALSVASMHMRIGKFDSRVVSHSCRHRDCSRVK